VAEPDCRPMLGYLSPPQKVVCCKTIRELKSCQVNKNKTSRRGFLALLRPILFLTWYFGKNTAVAAETSVSEKVCSFCNGKGQVVCDMCDGTGFWKAITPNRNQYYTGVSCPQCSGTGHLTCPVCLGTGLGQVKGLLRRNKKLGSGKGIFGTE